MDYIFYAILYLTGTLFGYYYGRNVANKKAIDTISDIIEDMINDGFLRHKRNKEGDIEILKWNPLEDDVNETEQKS